MTAIILALAVTVAPPPEPTQAEKLAGYIVTIYHGADSYAPELAERIIYEAEHFGLDVALLAAIAYNESWYQLSAKGTSGERGLWQVLPDSDWRKMSRADQRHWTRHIVISTWRAASIVAHHAARCGHSAACYCHYQSGYAKCRRSYSGALTTRSRAIRKAIN